MKGRLTSDPVCMTEKLICYSNKRAEEEATVVSNVGRVVRVLVLERRSGVKTCNRRGDKLGS